MSQVGVLFRGRGIYAIVFVMFFLSCRSKEVDYGELILSPPSAILYEGEITMKEVDRFIISDGPTFFNPGFFIEFNQNKGFQWGKIMLNDGEVFDLSLDSKDSAALFDGFQKFLVNNELAYTTPEPPVNFLADGSSVFRLILMKGDSILIKRGIEYDDPLNRNGDISEAFVSFHRVFDQIRSENQISWK